MAKKMRKMVKSGIPRYEVADELNVSISPVCNRTKDLPKQLGRHLGGHTLKFLKEVTSKGYFIPEPYETGSAKKPISI